jgi:hypothetical protein
MLFEGKDRRELEQLMKREGRLPPGQSLTLKWPVLHYGSVAAPSILRHGTFACSQKLSEPAIFIA